MNKRKKKVCHFDKCYSNSSSSNSNLGHNNSERIQFNSVLYRIPFHCRPSEPECDGATVLKVEYTHAHYLVVTDQIKLLLLLKLVGVVAKNNHFPSTRKFRNIPLSFQLVNK